jgi:NitT/TauT family transport system substrate-binding protein
MRRSCTPIVMSVLMCAGLGLAALVSASAASRADDKVSFITNWTAEAEHGGFYQAVATGIYKKYGLDVTMRQGGPSTNTAQMLAAGAIDLRMGSNTGGALNYVKEGVPAVVVAAMFQKEPSILMAHPGVGNDSLAALKGKPIAISRATIDTWWRFLVVKFGYTDDQLRPYNFNNGPFLVDKNLVQQGYVTSEPFAIEKEGKFKPVIFLLADDGGYSSYSTTIETTTKLVTEKPDLVQRFVNASIEGWYSYLYGDPAPANALIVKDNPEMTAEQIAFSIAKIKEYGIVDSGDSLKLGIGAMTDARWQSFFTTASSVGLYDKSLDYKKAYTLQFVNKGHGLDLKK